MIQKTCIRFHIIGVNFNIKHYNKNTLIEKQMWNTKSVKIQNFYNEAYIFE